MQKVAAWANGAAITQALDLGVRTGLFDSAIVLSRDADTGEPTWFSCAQLAEHAHCRERYVREWLSCLACAEVVDLEDATSSGKAEHARFRLRAEFAGVFVRGSPARGFPGMIGSLSHVTPHLAKVVKVAEAAEEEEEVEEEVPAGVPYSAYADFWETMGAVTETRMDVFLQRRWLPMAGDVYERLCGSALEGEVEVEEEQEQAVIGRVADLGCGSGHSSVLIARTFPRAHVVGLDLFCSTLEATAEEARAEGLVNLELRQEDVAMVDQLGYEFDLVCAFDVIHDLADPQGVLNKAYASLKEGGKLVMVDVAAHSNVVDNLKMKEGGALLYSVSLMHCMTVSLAQGGAGLGTCWGRELAVEMMENAGFKVVAVERAGDHTNLVYVGLKEGPRTSL